MNKKLLTGCAAFLLALLAVHGRPAVTEAQSSNTAPHSVAEQQALLNQYCVGCHNQTARAAGVDASRRLTLDDLDLADVSAHGEAWESVVRKLRAGMMPPVTAPRPDAATYEAMTVWLENELDRSTERLLPPPGLHRLNRTEYENVIRDLLLLEVDASTFLPPDDSSHGFDNMAGTLGLSPALLEAYVSAAGKISRLAVGNVTASTQSLYTVPADTTQNYHVAGLPFGTRGGTLIRHHFPVDGEYAIKVFTVKRGNMGGSGSFGGIREEKLEVSLNGERLGLFDWDQEVQSERGSGEPGTVDVRFSARAGTHTVGVTFLATHYAPLDDHNHQFMRTTIETGGIGGFTFFPHVGAVRVDGPFNPAGVQDSPTRQRIFVCRPADFNQEAACAEEIISNLVRNAFRRPAREADVDMLMEFFETGRSEGGFESGVEMALRRILADPEFIVRIEYGPEDVADGEAYRINGLDLASRLSFFLWSTGPDDELLDLATTGRLLEPAVLEAQVRRMLADPRADALARNFAGQWLGLRALQAAAPVIQDFPDFDDNLRQAFRRETELLFESVMREDRSILDLLTADYTFVNERLAKHYGIPDVYGSRFQRVDLGPDLDARRGLLGKGAVLTVSSQPGRTSPVKRGQWVLQTLLGVSPPDPPPNVPELRPSENDAAGNAREPSMRERMEEHRTNPACAGCHRIMDPIGFAMENFDAIGMWRTLDQGNVIDAADTVYDGTPVDGVAGLREWLLQYSDQYGAAVTEKLLTYALGRGVEHYDMPIVRAIADEAARDDYRFSSLVLGIVRSDPFQMNMKLSVSED